jgi:hypothetical protein
MALQDQWRFCNKCNAMFFDGFPAKGHCAADGGGHQAQGFMFTLPHDVPESPNAQGAWRFCNKCNEMFFDGSPDKGHCPAGGPHQAQGLTFMLPHDVPATPTTQTAWRFCGKCHAMFFDGFADKGHCPAGGGHSALGFMFGLPHIDPDTLNFDSGPLTTDLPLGGSAHLVIRRNGDFTFSTHAHDSGFNNIRYGLVAVLMASNGIAFTCERTGHLEGTTAGLHPKRNDDPVTSGNNGIIARNFDAIASGARFVATLSGNDVLVSNIRQMIEDAISDAAKQLLKNAATSVVALIV